MLRPGTRKFFLGLLAAGILWRLALSFVAIPAWEARAGVGSTPDAYPLLARTLVEEGSFGYGETGANPTTVRGPGFVGWLAISVFAGADDTRWLGFWGGLPGLLAGAWLASIVARKWGSLAGLAAGAVAILHPLPSLISSRVMGDDFYAALGFASLVLWTEALGRERARARTALTVGAGALLAVQMLARSSGLLTLAVAVGYGLIVSRRNGRNVLLLAVVALLPVLAWSVRTSRLEGRPVFVHSLTAYNFWIGEGFARFGPGPPPAGHYTEIMNYALEQAGPEFEDDRFWYIRLAPRQAAELERRLGPAARERILDAPLGYLVRVAKGVPAFWIGAMTSDRTLQYAVVVLPFVLLALFGIPRAWSDPLGAMLILTLAAHNLAYAAMFPMARMSVQVYPALAYLVGVCLARATAAGISAR